MTNSMIKPDDKNKPLIIEIAGTPNAGKDTQCKILEEYFREIRGYKVKVVNEQYETYVRNKNEQVIDKFLFAVLRTLLNTQYENFSEYDIVLINRGPFDLISYLNFYQRNRLSEKSISRKTANHIRELILSDLWKNRINSVILLVISPEAAIEREIIEQRKTVSNLARTFDDFRAPNPPQRVVNLKTLRSLNLAYQETFEKFSSRYDSVFYLKGIDDDDIDVVAYKIVNSLQDKLPNPGCIKIKEPLITDLSSIAKRRKKEIENFQLTLPGL